jgi:pimeloyl-ACP methyl ester carboxylesterase
LQYPRVYANPAQFDEQHYQEQWALMVHKQGSKALAGVASYMKERVRRGDRWTGPMHRLDLPFCLIWGQEDPVAVLNKLRGVGHYPQLEAPNAVAEALIAHSQHLQKYGDC